MKPHKTPTARSTVASHSAAPERCDTSVAGLGTALAHQQESSIAFFYRHLLQHLLLRSNPPESTICHYTVPGRQRGLTLPSARTIRPRSNVGGDGGLPVQTRTKCPATSERKLFSHHHRTGIVFPIQDRWKGNKETASRPST